MSPLIRRLLFNMYRSQSIHDSLADVFIVGTGVKQSAGLLIRRLYCLLSPSIVDALCYMTLICVEFAVNYNIIGNPANSKLRYINTTHTQPPTHRPTHTSTHTHTHTHTHLRI